MSVLAGLKPERVFYYFEELCRIPHGSGNTKEVSDYLVQFASFFSQTISQWPCRITVGANSHPFDAGQQPRFYEGRP